VGGAHAAPLFFDAKGRSSGCSRISASRRASPPMRTNRSASRCERSIALDGRRSRRRELHPRDGGALRNRRVLARSSHSISMPIAATSPAPVKYREVSRQPSVRRDLAVLLSRDEPARRRAGRRSAARQDRISWPPRSSIATKEPGPEGRVSVASVSSSSARPDPARREVARATETRRAHARRPLRRRAAQGTGEANQWGVIAWSRTMTKAEIVGADLRNAWVSPKKESAEPGGEGLRDHQGDARSGGEGQDLRSETSWLRGKNAAARPQIHRPARKSFSRRGECSPSSHPSC